MATTSRDVRPAGPGDAEAIAKVHDLAWRNAYRGIIPGVALEQMVQRRGPVWWARTIRRGGGVLVLEVGGVIAGYISVGRARMRRFERTGEVYELYIHPDYQGIGFGRELLQAGRSLLARNGLEDTVVRVLADNERATAFYRACGAGLAARSHETLGGLRLDVEVYAWRGGD